MAVPKCPAIGLAQALVPNHLDGFRPAAVGAQLLVFPLGPASQVSIQILIIDDERGLILGWRRLATRESPRTVAGLIRSCAGRRGVGP